MNLNFELDLGPGIFEYGQTYVAISRVRSIKGLYLYNFDPYRVFTHPKAIELYKKLEKHSSVVKK